VCGALGHRWRSALEGSGLVAEGKFKSRSSLAAEVVDLAAYCALARAASSSAVDLQRRHPERLHDDSLPDGDQHAHQHGELDHGHSSSLHGARQGARVVERQEARDTPRHNAATRCSMRTSQSGGTTQTPACSSPKCLYTRSLPIYQGSRLRGYQVRQTRRSYALAPALRDVFVSRASGRVVISRIAAQRLVPLIDPFFALQGRVSMRCKLAAMWNEDQSVILGDATSKSAHEST